MSMSDRELLELAAKAAGIEIVPCSCRYEQWPFKYAEGQGKRGHWNPLTDDGDALRLASGLCLNVLSSEACVVAEDEKGVECIEYFYGPEDYTSGWRRAIVRAAAEIGRSME